MRSEDYNNYSIRNSRPMLRHELPNDSQDRFKYKLSYFHNLKPPNKTNSAVLIKHRYTFLLGKQIFLNHNVSGINRIG